MASASAPVKPLTLPTVGKYTHLSNNEKRKIANRAYENEQQWIAEKESLAKVYDAKRKNWIKPEPKWGFIVKTVQEFFPELKEQPRDASTS